VQFTQEHLDIARSVADFVQKELNPHVAAWEEAGAFPIHEVFRKLGALGL
jgi:citronellyl-CoA dehydrogenase